MSHLNFEFVSDFEFMGIMSINYPTFAHLRHFSALYTNLRSTPVENVRQITPFYAKQSQLSPFFTQKRRSHEKTKPIQTQFNPKQTQLKPIQIQNKANKANKANYQLIKDTVEVVSLDCRIDDYRKL